MAFSRVDRKIFTDIVRTEGTRY